MARHAMAHATSSASMIAMALLLVPTSASADYESVAFAVRFYGYPGYCDDTYLEWARDDAEAWSDAIYTAAFGVEYDTSYLWLGTAVDSDDFVDADYFGNDETSPSGSDWADVVFFSGHGITPICGGALNTHYNGIEPGAIPSGGQQACATAIRMGGTQGTYNRVIYAAGGANSDVNYLMMHASSAVNYCAAQSGNMLAPMDAGNSGTQLTLINGFHNSPADEDHNDSEIYDYVPGVVSDAVGADWVDILSYRTGYGIGHECAVSYIVGYNKITDDSLYLYGGLKDMHDTGTHQYYWYYTDCSYDTCDFC